MKLIDGSTPKFGDVIQWHVDDTDDNITWTFTGIINKESVIYLGGGIDFGLAIGKQIPFSEVIQQAENNESHCTGITKIGVAMDIVRLIKTLSK